MGQTRTGFQHQSAGPSVRTRFEDEAKDADHAKAARQHRWSRKRWARRVRGDRLPERPADSRDGVRRRARAADLDAGRRRSRIRSGWKHRDRSPYEREQDRVVRHFGAAEVAASNRILSLRAMDGSVDYSTD